MAETALHHKLAAILAADAVGYSRLMHDDEPATVAQLDACRDIFRRHVEAHHGRIVDTAGDSVLATFETATGAVKAALAAQAEIAARNGSLPEGRRMQFRVGVNLGETFEKADGTIYGDGVNIAARLQALAEPGGACVSEAVVAQARGKVDAAFVSIGAHTVKNIAEPVRAFRLEPAGGAGMAKRRVAWQILAPAVALILALAAVGAWLWRDLAAPAPDEAAAEDPILALPKGPSIAVLPFANLSGDPEQEYFTDGITEQIITELTRFRELFVIGRNSTMQYKGKAVDVREVARHLGVRYVLEGSVRRSGETIRVTAQLLDASTGAHLWAETYDRDLTATDVFAVQDEITEQVVATVAQPFGVISQTAMSAAKAKRPESLSAYECVLKTFAYYEVLTPEAHLSARDCLERAVQTEPLYVDAWASLVQVYRHEIAFKFNPRPDAPPALDRMIEAAKRAVDLDPRNENARLALATAYFQRREFDPFFREAERALALNPNNSEVLATLAWQLAYAGQWDRGVALIKKAQALNPDHPGWYHSTFALNHYRQGEYDQAAAEFANINMPGWWFMHVGTAASYGQLGRKQEAQAAAKTLLDLKPDFLSDPRNLFCAVRNFPDELCEHLMDGLRKAGLEIPPETQ